MCRQRGPVGPVERGTGETPRPRRVEDTAGGQGRKPEAGPLGP